MKKKTLTKSDWFTILLYAASILGSFLVLVWQPYGAGTEDAYVWEWVRWLYLIPGSTILFTWVVCWKEKRAAWLCPLWFMLIGAGVWTMENLVSGVQSFHQLGAVIIPAVLLYGLPSQVAVVLFYVLQTMLKISDDYAEKLLRENREQQ